ncbi:vacuolar protein sorting protein 18 [Hyaloraphidium curvatum]|nr:vacuolar protein sorting protein 18 [Hyaloraphidium curvatum]
MSLFDVIEGGAGPPDRAAPPTPAKGPAKPVVPSAADAARDLKKADNAAARVAPQLVSRLEEAPVFALDRVQFAFPDGITGGRVSNGILALLYGGNRLLRINLEEASAVEDIELFPRKAGDVASKVFLDPRGRHIIVTTSQGNNYYLFHRWKKPKTLSRLKSVVIESIAWSRAKAIKRPGVVPNPDSTGPILIGTRQGAILEAEIQPTDELFKKEERYARQVYTLPPSIDGNVICGLRFEQFPTSSSKFVVFAATPTKLYQFIGTITPESEDSVFASLFRSYDAGASCQEIPGDISSSELHFWSPYFDDGLPSTPRTFGWLTAPGVYFGDLVFGSQGVGDSVIQNAQLLPYAAFERTPADGAQPHLTPLSIATLQFHHIVLYPDLVRAIGILSGEVAWEQPLGGERALVLASDRVKETHWLITNRGLWEIIVTEEDRDVWKIFLAQKKWETALKYAKTESQRDRIVTAQAEHYFSAKQYTLSATYFAQSRSIGFEDVALRFAKLDQRDAPLKVFLAKKLEFTRRTDTTQRLLLATWLTEIYIDSLNNLEAGPEVAPERTSLSPTTLSTEYRLMEEEFHSFLRANLDSLDKETVYRLLAAQGRTRDSLAFAEMCGDWDRVLARHMEDRRYVQCIEVLSKLDPRQSADLWYIYAPELMVNKPVETVNALIRIAGGLNPKHLIPALLKYEVERANSLDRGGKDQALRYLQYAVDRLGNTDPAVHNYLLDLFVDEAVEVGEDESGLLAFLRAEGGRRYYDVQLALRRCSQSNLTQACVFLYGLLGMYQDAVELALRKDEMALAQTYADRPEEDPELKKQLWMRIARHVIEEQKDIKTAIQFLKTSGVLKIADILPYFPDFVIIDDFKAEICEALEEYSEHIEQLRQEMDEATKAAENIRLDVRELRKRYSVVPTAEKCYFCRQPLLTRQCYVFPCGHCFHADELAEEVVKELRPPIARRMRTLQDQIARGQAAEPKDSGSKALTRLRDELDNIVAAECILCGDMMIRSTDRPFIRPDEDASAWAV